MSMPSTVFRPAYRRRAHLIAALAALVALAAIPAVAADDGTRLAIVPGGPHPYFAPMAPALDDAKKTFGLKDATYRVPASFSLNDENQTIERLAAQNYNAFAIFPDDANGTNATLAELAGRGITSVVVGACTITPTSAKFCLATDVYQAAYEGAKRVIAAIGGKGKIVHLTGLLIDPNTKLRQDGVAKAIAETQGAVTLVQTVADIDSPEPAAKAVNSLLAAQGNAIDGIVTTAYNPAVAAAKALSESKNQHIKLVAIDADPIVVAAIKDGYATGTIQQNAYGQAYIAAYALDQLVSHGCKMKPDAAYKIDSGTIYVTKSNVDRFADDLRALTTSLQKSFKDKYLAC